MPFLPVLPFSFSTFARDARDARDARRSLMASGISPWRLGHLPLQPRAFECGASGTCPCILGHSNVALRTRAHAFSCARPWRLDRSLRILRALLVPYAARTCSDCSVCFACCTRCCCACCDRCVRACAARVLRVCFESCAARVLRVYRACAALACCAYCWMVYCLGVCLVPSDTAADTCSRHAHQTRATDTRNTHIAHAHHPAVGQNIAFVVGRSWSCFPDASSWSAMRSRPSFKTLRGWSGGPGRVVGRSVVVVGGWCEWVVRGWLALRDLYAGRAP